MRSASHGAPRGRGAGGQPGATDGRRRTARRREVPLASALESPETLLDRLVLALVLGPPRARAGFRRRRHRLPR